LDINFTVGISCERAAPLAEKNAAARHHVLRSLISMHNEHRVYWTRKMLPRGTRTEKSDKPAQLSPYISLTIPPWWTCPLNQFCSGINTFSSPSNSSMFDSFCPKEVNRRRKYLRRTQQVTTIVSIRFKFKLIWVWKILNLDVIIPKTFSTILLALEKQQLRIFLSGLRCFWVKGFQKSSRKVKASSPTKTYGRSVVPFCCSLVATIANVHQLIFHRILCFLSPLHRKCDR
jgi:hypothetical protein